MKKTFVVAAAMGGLLCVGCTVPNPSFREGDADSAQVGGGTSDNGTAGGGTADGGTATSGTAGSWSDGTGGSSSGGTATGEPFPCSYGLVVYTYGGSIYAVKVSEDSTACTFTNKTSGDRSFTYSCNGNTYDNPDYVLNMNGSAVPTYTGPQPCSAFFTVAGPDVSAKAGVTIIFAVAKSGSFATHFAAFCPPASGVTQVAFPACGKS